MEIPQQGNCETCFQCGLSACKNLTYSGNEPDGCSQSLEYVDGDALCPEFKADPDFTMSILCRCLHDKDIELLNLREVVGTSIYVIEEALIDDTKEDQVKKAIQELKKI